MTSRHCLGQTNSITNPNILLPSAEKEKPLFVPVVLAVVRVCRIRGPVGMGTAEEGPTPSFLIVIYNANLLLLLSNAFVYMFPFFCLI